MCEHTEVCAHLQCLRACSPLGLQCMISHHITSCPNFGTTHSDELQIELEKGGNTLLNVVP